VRRIAGRPKPASAPHVRRARRSDLPALETLWREIDAHHARLLPRFFRAPAGSPRSVDFVNDALGGPNELVLVAEDTDPDRLLGLVHVQLYDTPPVPTMVARRRAHIEDLVVARGRRRAGVGRRLMDEARRWATQHGACEIVLTVWAGNEGARRFYRALGFDELARVLYREC
jgi:ribosomal protein S18 acetylase RimI-like enzyme